MTHLSQAADEHLRADMLIELKEADRLLALLSYLIRDLHGFDPTSGFLGTAQFSDLFKQFKQWAQFTNDPAYGEVREAKKALLLFSAEAAASIAGEILNDSQPWMPFGGSMNDKATELVDQVCQIASRHVISQLRKRFLERNGIGGLVGASQFLAHRWILFRIDSGFYAEEGIAFLRGLAERAHRDRVAHENCLEFLLILSKGGGADVVSSEDRKRMVQRKDIIGILWGAAVSNQLNPRTTGTVKEVRELLKTVAGDDSHLPVPTWWTT